MEVSDAVQCSGSRTIKVQVSFDNMWFSPHGVERRSTPEEIKEAKKFMRPLPDIYKEHFLEFEPS